MASSVIQKNLQNDVNILNKSLAFRPFSPVDNQAFDEGKPGYTLEVLSEGTVIGYLAFRARNYVTPSGAKIAIDFYDTTWNLVWSINRRD